jgi:hypothetical protein
MKALRLYVCVWAALSMGAISIAHAEPIVLGVFGQTDISPATVVPTAGGTLDLTLPPGTWTPTFELGPNNIGLTTSTPLHFAGATFHDVQLNGTDILYEVPDWLSFTTPLGSFQFDSILANVLEIEPNPLTDGQFAVASVGILTGEGYDPTLTFVFTFLNFDGGYGNAAFFLFSPRFLADAAIPEPSSLILTGLGLGALVWRQRRARV